MGFSFPGTILLFAVAISIDGFSVGITYGLRGIRIGKLPLLIIVSISTFSIYLTTFLGTGLAAVLDPKLGETIGSFILIGVGFWLIYNAFFNHYSGIKDRKSNKVSDDDNEKILISLNIRPFGLIIKVFKEPVTADFDKSGTINNIEALFLGLALALDALGAGFGAGMTGFSNSITPLIIGFINLVFITGGSVIGNKLGNILPGRFEILPGLLIVILGMIKLL